MKDEVKRMVTEEVINEVEEIGKQELGTDVHMKTTQAVNNMMDRLIKVDEIENEKRKLDLEERKLDIEERKLEHDKRHDWWKIGVGLFTFGASMGFTYVGYKDNKRFEKEGFMPSTESGRIATKNLLNFFDKFK